MSLTARRAALVCAGYAGLVVSFLAGQACGQGCCTKTVSTVASASDGTYTVDNASQCVTDLTNCPGTPGAVPRPAPSITTVTAGGKLTTVRIDTTFSNTNTPGFCYQVGVFTSSNGITVEDDSDCIAGTLGPGTVQSDPIFTVRFLSSERACLASFVFAKLPLPGVSGKVSCSAGLRQYDFRIHRHSRSELFGAHLQGRHHQHVPRRGWSESHSSTGGPRSANPNATCLAWPEISAAVKTAHSRTMPSSLFCAACTLIKSGRPLGDYQDAIESALPCCHVVPGC